MDVFLLHLHLNLQNNEVILFVCFFNKLFRIVFDIQKSRKDEVDVFPYRPPPVSPTASSSISMVHLSQLMDLYWSLLLTKVYTVFTFPCFLPNVLFRVPTFHPDALH